MLLENEEILCYVASISAQENCFWNNANSGN